MKKNIFSFIAAVIVFASLAGCSNNDDLTSEVVSVEGRFLMGKTGAPMIVIESSGPCTISSNDDTMFSEFTNGDLIELKYNGIIATTYPGQIHHVYDATLIEDGDISDIDESTLEALKEMGHIE